MVELQPSKLIAWVRFPSPAPFADSGTRKRVGGRKHTAPVGGGNGRKNGENFAHIAQSVEHFLGKEEVTGSIPVMGSMILDFPGYPGPTSAT